MSVKKSEILTVAAFCAFLFAILLCYLLLPKESYSQLEKRYLAEAPSLTWESLTSGDWGEDVESYLADHMPGRNFFVGLNAYFDLYTGRQAGKDIWVVGDRLVEAPVEWDETALRRNMATINTFAETLGQAVDFAIVPSAGWATGTEGYFDDSLITAIYGEAGENLDCLDFAELFAGKQELFYRTDHHWNSDGAYTAYSSYMAHVGRESAPKSSFTITSGGTFYGSTYSRSGLWLTAGEEIALWQGSSDLTVTNGENPEPHAGVLYPERLAEADKYTVFLDSNHSLVRIQNPAGQGKLLVIRDSFGNSLGGFLAESWQEVVLVDLRYYKQPVSQLVEQEGFDDVLICYSIGNFLSDTNLPLLR